MSNVSFYGQAHCGDCGATWVFEPIEDGSFVQSDHECPNDDEEPTR
jgi:hypothetical protein